MSEREAVCDRVVLRPASGGEGGPLRRVAGESVAVEVEVFAFGDEVIRCALRFRPPAGEGGEEPEWSEVAMSPAASAPKVWRGAFDVPLPGLWRYDVAAWVDDFATWQRLLGRDGEAAGFEAGGRLFLRASEIASAAGRAGHAKVLAGLARTFLADDGATSQGERLRLALDPELAPLLDRFLGRPAVTSLPAPGAVAVEPAGTAARSWFVLGGGKEGEDPAAALPAAVAMGFDCVVLPCPSFLDPHGSGAEGDPAIPPLRQALEAVRSQGMTPVLDLPLRFPAGHPLRAERPGWFQEAGPGEADLALAGEDWEALWRALSWALSVWVGEGISVFHVSRPESAPPGFWAWLTAEVRESHPGVAFWARSPERADVRDHLRAFGLVLFDPLPPLLTAGEIRDRWVGEGGRTPSAGHLSISLAPAAPIVPLPGVGEDGSGASEALFHSLERSALAGLVLAATGASSYGLSGLSPDADPRSRELARLLARLNQIRRSHPLYASAGKGGALRVLPTEDPELFVYGSLRGKDFFVVVLGLDEARPHASWIEIPLADLGLKEEAVFHVEDLMSGVRYLWQGRRNSVRIDPAEAPVQVLRLVR